MLISNIKPSNTSNCTIYTNLSKTNLKEKGATGAADRGTAAGGAAAIGRW
jgi:hypothetical protein